MSNQRAAWTDKVKRDALAKVSKRTKFNNRKVSYEGLEFDSRAEFNTWRDLELQQRAGQISELRRQVPFPLYAFAHFAQREQVAEYVADFVYTRAGVLVVADRKSAMTRKLPLFRLKAKMFAANYGFDITEIL